MALSAAFVQLFFCYGVVTVSCVWGAGETAGRDFAEGSGQAGTAAFRASGRFFSQGSFALFARMLKPLRIEQWIVSCRMLPSGLRRLPCKGHKHRLPIHMPPPWPSDCRWSRKSYKVCRGPYKIIQNHCFFCRCSLFWDASWFHESVNSTCCFPFDSAASILQARERAPWEVGQKWAKGKWKRDPCGICLCI